MKRIALIATGGTISMEIDPQTDLAVPVLSGKQLLQQIPSHMLDCTVDAFDMERVGGGQLTMTLFSQIAKTISQMSLNGEYDGFVITQGTDSIEESAYLLDLIVDIPHPIVVTGSMRNASELGYEGAANLHQAIDIAISPSSWNRGVVVAFANEIFSAVDVVKTDTSHVRAFEALGKGPIGKIMQRKVIYYQMPHVRQNCKPEHVDSRVTIIKAGLGEDGEFIKTISSNMVDGYVIEGTGVGNGQYWMEDWIQQQTKLGKPVVITSRAPCGWVDTVYGYPGSSSRLIERGAIKAIGISSVKARIKLISILGQTKDLQVIQKFFDWM